MSKLMELWGIEDVAKQAGVSVNRAAVWRHRGKLPEPEWFISGRPVWRATTIRKWFDNGGIEDRRRTVAAE